MTLNDGGTIWQHPELSYSLSDRNDDVDTDAVHGYLTTSYWAEGIRLETVERSIREAHCFSLFDSRHNQVGFARVVSDHATFAWLGDVYVLEPHRRLGLANWMMDLIMGHADLQGLRRWTLATRDMHALYRKFGFTSLVGSEKQMEFLPKQTDQ